MHPGATSDPSTIESSERLAPGFLRTAQLTIVFLGIIGGCVLILGKTLPRAWGSLQTDFPNYYIVAHLVRKGYDTSRIYEWTWIQREKDRLGIDQPIVGTTALTPFSFLAALPLTYFEPLTAKRIWTIANLLFAAISAILLKRVSGMRWQWIVLLFLFCFPMHTNIVLGQMYLLLLCILTIALWAHLRGQTLIAGILVGIAAGLKVFPILFVFYFLRKRDWRAVTGVVIALTTVFVISLAVFGSSVLWEYLSRQLIWASRGEALDPYNLQSASISSLLHRLFVFEPQLNPLPLIRAPRILAVMLPVFQTLIFCPILLLCNPRDSSARTLTLEWATVTIGILAISTFPASYHFTVLLLPVALIFGICLAGRRVTLAVIVAGLFVFVGVAGSHSWNGAEALLGVPRLYALIALCGYGIALMRGIRKLHLEPDTIGWATILVAGCFLLAIVGLRHQRQLFDDYQRRLPIDSAAYLSLSPVADQSSGSLQFIAMTGSGYEVVTSAPSRRHSADELSFASMKGALVIERTTQSSRLEWVRPPGMAPVQNARNPAIAPNKSALAFVRDEKGRGRLWLQSMYDASEAHAVTPPDMNVLEAAVGPDGGVVFSTEDNGMVERTSSGEIKPLSHALDRYPSISLDGQWLAFSRLERGVWNLWLTNLRSKQSRRISHVDCDQVTPSWQDAETLLYATDCGRGLMVTALARRNIAEFIRP